MGRFLIKCCLVLIKSTPDIVYGVARENNAVDLLPYQKQGKTILVIASTLPKMHGKVSLDILDFFLLIHSERAFNYYCGKRDIRR